MKRCWLHVGMHKTGTTSVQHNLRKIGNTGEWRYLCVGAKLHMNIPFFAMFATDPLSYKWFGRLGISSEEAAGRGEHLRSRLAEAIRSSPEETIIMSAEALTLIDAAGIQRLRDFLAPFFDEIKVIGYVRPPVSFKVSIYQELIKQGRKRFDAFDIRISYREKFEKFDKSFGRDNVMLVKFDPRTFPDSCMVSEFCGRTGIRLAAGTAVERANDGMCQEACGILYAYYKHGPGYGTGKRVIIENGWIIKPLQAMRGTKLAIRKSLFRGALERESEDIAWMEERLGVPLAEKLEDKENELAGERDLLRIARPSFLAFVDHFESHNKITLPRDMIPPGEVLDPVAVADFVELCRDLARVKHEREGRKRQKGAGKAHPASDVPPSKPPGLKKRCVRMLRGMKGGVLDALSNVRSALGGLVFNRTEKAVLQSPDKRSSALRGKRDPQSVIGTYKKAVRYNRNDASGYLGLGVCQLRLGEWSQARGSIAAAIFLKPDEKRWFRYYRHAMKKTRGQGRKPKTPATQAGRRNG